MDHMQNEYPSPGKPHILSVSEITEYIRESLEGQFLNIWISGEVTNFRSRTSNHWYFGLKDDKAQISTVIFNGLSRRFPFELEDGLEVICHGKLSVYAPRGTYSLIVDHIEPKGKGALQLAFEQLKAKLEKEGLFRAEHKKALPFLPKKIAVITSPTGAAVRDIIHVLTRRFAGVDILVVPAKVQGEGAAEEVAKAIEDVNQLRDVDLLIVGRGGGSLEDLWAFNEESVARALFASRIPTISAVGHEIDFTIADFVADVRAPTPSAAAEIAVPVKQELMQQITDRFSRLKLSLKQTYITRMMQLEQLRERLADPTKRFPELLIQLDHIRERIVQSLERKIERETNLLSKYASNLEHLSPLHILAKGYAVLQNENGETIRSVKQVNIGEELSAKVHEGEMKLVRKA
ncbi:MAG: exodeoxyribonuclease VII large subunit [Deltaproteobacteria bacterium CG_4_10_14_0_2_um_filter_43_8]|nr:MAG: exodeoxyribonuclease VII large subunit [Deltaproteobacteria bacterium CG11_big_fil_rev_8_21_14_0_20_42_23]PJA21627.1 MAG: exodeoxyribonuclease VII large subunit [Deltaproteobacteria bacterium CG_4_10_14_0_2_um_filter_43_8]PJC65270.1 MAG: exodeoxyribonuclease VII large subunit [Deltaproteobacteria bacterium CG_4_9_14_0_2_um_filter_42_21]